MKLFLVLSLVSLNPTTLGIEQHIEVTEMVSEKACLAERDRYRASPVWSRWASADCLNEAEVLALGQVSRRDTRK